MSWFELLRSAVLSGDMGLAHALVEAVRPLAMAVVHLPEGDVTGRELVDYASLLVDLGHTAGAEDLLKSLLLK